MIDGSTADADAPTQTRWLVSTRKAQSLGLCLHKQIAMDLQKPLLSNINKICEDTNQGGRRKKFVRTQTLAEVDTNFGGTFYKSWRHF